MDITILHKLMDEYYELSMFPKVKQTLERKDGRVIMSYRSFAPKEWGMKDSTGRKYDLESTKREIQIRKDEIAGQIYHGIKNYLEAYGVYNEVLQKIGPERTFDNAEAKMHWCQRVLYYLETYDIIPRVFLSKFKSHAGVEIGVKKISEETVFKEREDEDDKAEI